MLSKRVPGVYLRFLLILFLCSVSSGPVLRDCYSVSDRLGCVLIVIRSIRGDSCCRRGSLSSLKVLGFVCFGLVLSFRSEGQCFRVVRV